MAHGLVVPTGDAIDQPRIRVWLRGTSFRPPCGAISVAFCASAAIGAQAKAAVTTAAAKNLSLSIGQIPPLCFSVVVAGYASVSGRPVARLLRSRFPAALVMT